MPKPYVGQVVLYANHLVPRGAVVPAIVTRVRTDGSVNLQVFHNNAFGAESFVEAVPYGDSLTVGSWFEHTVPVDDPPTPPSEPQPSVPASAYYAPMLPAEPIEPAPADPAPADPQQEAS